MAYWCAQTGDAQQHAPLTRFDPRFWTVNFPRPMMAAATTSGPHSLRVDAAFYRANDLAGLIWESEDRHDHPLLAYETSRDYRGLTLRFRWKASGLIPLNAVYGPTLTIEGRDASGAARSWYVRLWNYAKGTPDDAEITLNFDALAGGFLLPGEADPVWAGDIDRLFIALVPPGYDGTDTALAAPVEGWAELSDMACIGPGSVIAMGDVLVPPNGLAIATGYDDSYHLTPERLLRNAFHLGYRGPINHYVGMSHYFRLRPNASRLDVTLIGGALNSPASAWHRDFTQRAKNWGFGFITSLSFELLDAHCPETWKQRAANGDPALTGWSPPSTLLSPAHAEAMAYLKAVARAFVSLAVAAGHAPRFQVGEPWWWIMPDGRICLYDASARSAFGGNPPVIATIRSASLTAAQKALLDQAGALLSQATQALANDVRTAFPGCERLLLVYVPTVLDPAAPEAVRANVPLGWKSPAFDILQLEDYDWVTEGRTGDSAAGRALMDARLGYGVARQHYLSGFVLRPQDTVQWAAIDAAAVAAQGRGVAASFIWALPQVLRDGFTHFQIEHEEADVQAFDDVDFPIAIGRAAQVRAGYSTAIVTTAAGHEQRNSAWANGRLHFDAGPGVRSGADVESLLQFFRARRGAARGFRFRDPMDQSSNGMTKPPTPLDIRIGTGDGQMRRFPLIKRYGVGDEAEVRRITRPLAASVTLAVNGAPLANGWTLEPGGWVSFATPPAAGAAVTAGFVFDVPVRFESDQLEISLYGVTAGEVPSVPLIEVRDI